MKLATLLSAALLIVFLSGCASSLHDVTQNNNTAAMQNMLAKGANVNQRNNFGQTPLLIAATNGNYVPAKLLLDRGANPNLVDNPGSSPLLYAARYGHTEIVNLLLEKGADVNLANLVGDVPLTWAALNGHIEIAKLLIGKGANVNIVTKNNSTPLLLAIFGNKSELVKLLIEKGANLHVTNQTGDTPLILAAFKGNTETVKLLLTQGVDINPRNQNGKSAEDFAREKGYSAILAAINEARQGIAKQAQQPQPQQLAELEALVASKNMQALKAFLDKTPTALALIKDNDLRLQLTGPAELRIVDIAALVSAKKKDTLIIAQINSSGGPYKKFSLAEMEALQKLGISDEVIAAMITVTTEYNKEQKRQPAPQSPQPAPIAPVEQSYKQAPPTPASPQQDAQNPQSNECIQLALAIKACDKGSGFIPLVGGLASEGCKAAARSKFNCSLPLEMIMR